MTITTETCAGDGLRRYGKTVVAGALTIYDAAAGKQSLLSALGKVDELEIDLSAVTEMDTAGLQLLIMLKRAAIANAKDVRLVAHSPATLEVIDRYDLAGYFGDPVVLSSRHQPHTNK